MERWRGQIAVVTGASAGIGAAIAGQLVDAGLKVVGIARRKEKLEELALTLKEKDGSFYFVTADMTVESDILQAFKWIKENVGPVSILINNAGVSRTTTLISGETKLWQDVLNTNVLALCIATREVVTDMRANNIDGHIVHINSIAGHTVVAIPFVNVYAASKHAVTALTETLRNELNEIQSKIKISSVSPGLVTTEISEANARDSGLGEISEERRERMKKEPFLDAQDVANAVVYILGTPPHVQIHELIIKPVGEKI